MLRIFLSATEPQYVLHLIAVIQITTLFILDAEEWIDAPIFLQKLSKIQVPQPLSRQIPHINFFNFYIFLLNSKPV